MEYYIKDGELYHHGTKGMKWGRRRYQNPDGSLTALGRIRYGAGKAGDKLKGVVKGAVDKHRAKKAAEKESERIQKLMKKPVGKLTEAELAERTALAKKQKELRQIESESDKLDNSARSFLSKFGDKMLNDAVIPAAVNAGKGVAEKWLSKKLSDAFGLTTKNPLDDLKKAVDELDLKKRKRDLEDSLSGKKDDSDRLKREVEELDLKKRKRDLEDSLSGKKKEETDSERIKREATDAMYKRKLAETEDWLKDRAERAAAKAAEEAVSDAKKSEEYKSGKEAADTILSDEDKD